MVKLRENWEIELMLKMGIHTKSQTMFDNDLIVIRKSKAILRLKKPAYVGMCILYLSKLLMYKFHYDYIKNKYGNISRLLFTDTDSFMYEINTEDVYRNFIKDKGNVWF